jgi:hypothetical protein
VSANKRAWYYNPQNYNLNSTQCESLKVTYVQKYIEQLVLKPTTNFIPLLGMSSSPEDLVDLKSNSISNTTGTNTSCNK